MGEARPDATVALTGATGFIGGRLIRRFIGDGYRVRALLRPESPSRLSAMQGQSLEQITVGLGDAAALDAALADAAAVVHCAGAVRGRIYADFELANVTSVARVAAAAARAELPLLLMSSLAASEPHLSDYARSKAAGERALQSADVAWTVLRPPAVYGPGDREMLGILRCVWRGVTPVVGPSDQRLALLHVDDLASAVLAWLSAHERCREGVFSLHDGHDAGYGWDEIGRAGRRGRAMRINVPRPLLAGMARLNLALARHLDYLPMLTPGKVRELCQPRWLCDNGPFTEATGWQPSIGLEQGLADLFAGNADHG